MAVGAGVLARIDGPAPLAPLYGLLQAAAKATAIRVVPDADVAGIERWGNGVEVYPYPADTGGVYDACSAYASFPRSKDEGTTADRPQFPAFTVYLPETCTSARIWNQDEFKARAVIALSAVEGRLVEYEFMNGSLDVLAPHLADGNGTFPNADVATNVVNGFALLENEIADTGRQGVIHCTPALAVAAMSEIVVNDDRGVLRTANGTVVVPGQGYVGSHPAGHAAASGTKEWAYATGPIDVRRSEVFVNPPTVGEALDRETNSVTYRAERYYAVIWDGVLQSAVLIDRCQAGCTA